MLGAREALLLSTPDLTPSSRRISSPSSTAWAETHALTRSGECGVAPAMASGFFLRRQGSLTRLPAFLVAANGSVEWPTPLWRLGSTECLGSTCSKPRFGCGVLQP